MSRIPATITAAKSRLTAIGSLVQASEWERAAIVAAFVEVSATRAHVRSDMRSCEEFAALGIVGLRSKTTVQRYHDAWMNHSGYVRPEPGMDIPTDLPEWGSTVPPVATPEVRADWNAANVAKHMEKPDFAAKVAAQMTPRARLETDKAVTEARRRLMDTISDDERGARRRDKLSFDKAARSLMWEMSDGYVRAARAYLVKAVEHVRKDGWPQKDAADLITEIDQTMSLLRMMRADLAGDSGTNWDSELATLLGGAS